jgi:single-strand DNA-binding protein
MNIVILSGNVGQDPKIWTFGDGGSIASFSLATTKRGYTLKNGTKVEEQTDWHNITARGSLAKLVSDYVKKGTKLLVRGELKNRTRTDKDGNKRHIVEVVADSFEFIGAKPASTSINQHTEGNALSDSVDDYDVPF